MRKAWASLRRDAVLPGLLAALGTVELVSLRAPRLLAVIAVEVAACALLVYRKRWTLVACTTCVPLLLSMAFLGMELNEPAVPILVVGLASFSLARYLPVRRALVGVTTIFVAVVVTQRVTVWPPPVLSDAIFVLAILAPPFAFGWLMQRLDASHAAQTRLLLERHEAARREAVAAERARIARELHDLLAHSISAMVVQAEAASALVPRAPDRAVTALHEVTNAGRAALTETGRVLRLIRDSDDELGLRPDLGLHRLPELLDGFRRSGLQVDFRVDGPLDGLPAGIEMSAYRIAEEALTNALKYAVNSTASLTLTRTPNALSIAATNRAATSAPRSGDPGSPGGLGLVGMQERVSAFGGSLSCGFRPDGTFQLKATLPLTQEPP